MTSDYHLFGIGNALLDTEYRVPDQFLEHNNIAKGQMTLIDATRRQALIKRTEGKPHDIGAGGSVANSIYAAQGFGCRNYFAGVVQADEVGVAYVDEFSKVGIDTLPPRNTASGASGQCLIYVTPDGQRSMNTSIGIADSFNLIELPRIAIRNSAVAFVEGYLAGSSTGTEAGRTVIQCAREAGVLTSMTLGDVSIIENCKSAIEYMIGTDLNVLFANINEAQAWCNASTVEATFEPMLEIAHICVVTRSEKGCIVLQREHSPIDVPGFPKRPLDSSGAGDLFAGAFLTGIVNDWDAHRCAHFANFAAATIVQDYGTRLHSFAQYSEIWNSFHQKSKPKGTS